MEIYFYCEFKKKRLGLGSTLMFNDPKNGHTSDKLVKKTEIIKN